MSADERGQPRVANGPEGSAVYPRRMRAIVRDRYGSPDVLRLAEVDVPVPGGDEVLVKVHATSVNTADVDLLRGRPPAVRLGTGLRRPRRQVLGLDLAGRVEAVGEDVTQFSSGDEVWADFFGHGLGAFAEYVCAPQDAFSLKPARTTFEEAATIPHSAVMALQSLRSARPTQPGDRVLINGAGGCVGPFAVQLAKSYGAEVTAVDHTGKLDFLREIGADHVIDYTREDFINSGQRYDAILDIAPRRSRLRLRRSLRPNGSYVKIARSLVDFLQLIIVGRWITWTSRQKAGAFPWRPNDASDLEELGRLLGSGEITPRIDRCYKLAQLPEALRYLESGSARGKIVITC